MNIKERGIAAEIAARDISASVELANRLINRGEDFDGECVLRAARNQAKTLIDSLTTMIGATI